MPQMLVIGKMLWTPSNRLFVARLIVVGLGVGLVVLLYVLGFPNLAAVSALSGLYVVAFSLLRAGTFSTTWLERHTPRSARRAATLEVAKALICAGVGIDGLTVLLFGPQYGFDFGLTDILSLTWVLLVVVGIGLFVVRAFAAYVVSIRR